MSSTCSQAQKSIKKGSKVYHAPSDVGLAKKIGFLMEEKKKDTYKDVILIFGKASKL